MQDGDLVEQLALLLSPFFVDPLFGLDEEVDEVCLFLHSHPWQVVSDFACFLKGVRVGVHQGSELVLTEIVFLLQVDQLRLSLMIDSTALLVLLVVDRRALAVKPFLALSQLLQKRLPLFRRHVDVVLFLAEPGSQLVDQRLENILGDISHRLLLVTVLKGSVSFARGNLLTDREEMRADSLLLDSLQSEQSLGYLILEVKNHISEAALFG